VCEHNHVQGNCRRCEDQRTAEILATGSDPATLAYRDAPDTSHEAAAANPLGRSRKRAMILRLLKAYPASAEELAVAIGLDVRQVSPRMVELRRAGLAQWTGKRVPTRLGREAYRCCITGAGVAALAAYDAAEDAADAAECPACYGTGVFVVHDRADPETCERCGGRGRVS
jgi:hypothetical protein